MLDRELNVAVKLACEAGAYLRTCDRSRIEVSYKSAGDPVTEADVRANTLIVEGLAQAFPDDAIVAEEGGDVPARAGKRTWFVDPIDGTKEFIAGKDDFAVMIGLAIDERAQLGVVLEPTRDRLYAGVVGHGATVTHRGVTQPLKVGRRSDPAQLRLVQSRDRRTSVIDRLAGQLHIVHQEQRGSMGIKACLVAGGSADLYVSLSSRSCVWDSCGPEAIVHAAGGRFVDLAGRPLLYAEGRVRNVHGLMASNSACFDRVLPDVRAVAESIGLV